MAIPFRFFAWNFPRGPFVRCGFGKEIMGNGSAAVMKLLSRVEKIPKAEPEGYINMAESPAVEKLLPDFKGKIKFSKIF